MIVQKAHLFYVVSLVTVPLVGLILFAALISPATLASSQSLPRAKEFSTLSMISSSGANGKTYFDDFSRYTPGFPPTGWLIRGTALITPTVEEVGGIGPTYRLVNFPEVPWQYWDKWLLKDNLILLPPYTVTVRMNFQNGVADRAGLTIAWNDTNMDRIDIQANVYWDNIEFRVRYTGPISSNISITNSGYIPINPYTDYWLRVVATNDGPGQGRVVVYWSTDNVTFQPVIIATGIPNLVGLAGISTAGPHLPHVYFDDFAVECECRFLDLPFAYTLPFSQVARGNVHGLVQGSPGRVNSWFDHQYPTYDSPPNNRSPGLVRWNDKFFLNPGKIGKGWYDGHNGIDFQRSRPNEEVFAAAPGTVFKTVTGCTVGDEKCGSGYGNQVWIDHHNGYATLYAHLDAVYISQGTEITDPRSQPLGTMGSTGNSSGPHLHFGVYYDQNGDGRWTKDEVVDPYGWQSSRLDPWVDVGGPVSYYLWKHPFPASSQTTGTQGAVITNTTGTEWATIPPDAFSGQAIFEISPAPVAESSAQLRTAGHSFWLRLLEWIPGTGGAPRVPAGSQAATLQAGTQFTLAKPITFTVWYTDTDVLHLDVSQLTLYRWDEGQQRWQPLPTTIDPLRRTVTAQTWELGEFDLQAPLLCPTDALEPDDGYAAARWVWPNDWPLQRGLDIPQDRDWVRFEAMQGVTYTVRTQNLAGGADTVLNLYDVDAWTLLATNDDARGRPGSELVWRAPYSGTFFVEVVPALASPTNCSATYELVIETIPGDVVADCRVDEADVNAVSQRWRLRAADPDPDGDATTPNYETRFDVNRDGTINVLDVLQVAAEWGKRCP